MSSRSAPKKKPGRTPKPATRRTHPVFVRFNDDEHARLLAAAQRCPLATFVREKALAS